MLCPICGGDTKVINSRERAFYVYRKRECKECGHRFETEEKEKAKKDVKNRTYRSLWMAGSDPWDEKPVK